MARKRPSWVLPLAVGLVLLGLAEDLTAVFIGVGILTSLAGAGVYYYGVVRRR